MTHPARTALRQVPPGRRGDGGFTLVELIVSLAMLALILALVPGALATGKRGWEDQRAVLRHGEASNALEAVRTRLEGALPVFDKLEEEPPRLAFRGEPQALVFVTASSGGPIGGGLFRHEIALRNEKGGQPRLALTLRSFDHTRPDTVAVETRNLTSTLTKVSFRYFGARDADEAPAWYTEWLDTEQLPELVLIETASTGGTAMRMLAELRLR